MEKQNTKIVREYLLKYDNSIPSRTIAKELNAKFPGHNIEYWRVKVRYIRGTSGIKGRTFLKDKSLVTQPYSTIPETSELDWTPFIVPNKYKRGVILSDIHFPYHDKKALDAAINYSIQFKPDFVVLNGDILDCYGLSRFAKNPKNPGLQFEINCFLDFLDDVKEKLNNPKIYYKIGNHEERLEQILWNNPSIFGLDAMKFENHIEAEERNITVIDEQRIVKIGKLPLLHGHEFNNRSAGQVNPARGLFLKARHISAIGHHHRSSEQSISNIDDDIITTWSIGCLCYLHPRYARINDWNHGFATIEVVDKDGNFHFNNKRIYKGIVL